MTRLEALSPTMANVFAALITHTWLRRYDPVPVYTVLYTLAMLPFITTSVFVSSAFLSVQIPPAITALQGYLVFYLSLLCSVAAYRLSPFHPLAKYPGPLILRLTKLWTVWVAYRGKNHLYLKSLHDKYGPTIRIGPNELSTIEKDFVPEILGIHGLGKGPMWDGRRYAQNSEEAKKPYRSIIDCRSASIHAQLRKPWSRSFTAEPLQNYERLLLRRIVHLNYHLGKQITASRGISQANMAHWMAALAFDFMGDIAFGTSFEIMRDGDIKGEYKAVTEGLHLPSVVQHIPWFADIARAIPSMSSKTQTLIAMGVENGVKRSQKELKHKDLFYYIAEALGVPVTSTDIILSDAITAIVAGSDTTASVMTNTIHLLLTHPDASRALVAELDEAFQKHDIPNLSAINPEEEIERFSDVLAGLQYLNGVLNETLRLYPPVPSGIQRAPEPGSGGRMLHAENSDDVFLPEGSAICVPPWALHRDPRYFSPHPDEFIPERWFGDAAVYKTTREVFIPFSTGPRNCVGRPIATTELRYAIATIFHNFNMEINHDKYDAKLWNAQILDRFTLSNGALDVNMSFRNKVQVTNA